MRLTKRTVEALEPRTGDYFEWDAELRGFGVRVLTTGRKTYLVQYRAGGRTRRVKLGTHGAITADQARTKAKETFGDIAKGENPAEVIRTERRAPTLAAACDRFLLDHVAVRCKPKTEHEYRRTIEKIIKPKLGTHRLGDITRADISKLHHELRDTPYQANRVLSILSKLFNCCELWGLRAEGANPCRLIAKYPERKRERFLGASEIKELGRVLDACQADGSETAHVCAAFRLLALTGCRLREIQTLKWDYIAGGYLNLPDTKTGARKIPLTPEAQSVLATVPRLEDNPHVIVGEVKGQHITDLERPWRRIRKRAGLEEVRIHDLRHTYASNALASGLPIEMVGKLLGHSNIQTTARYAHLADQAIRDAAVQVSTGLSDAMVGSSALDKTVHMNNVVEFKPLVSNG